MASMETEQQPQQTTEQIEVKTKRVQCFIDGYNLYHAIEETGNKALHWVEDKSDIGKYTFQDLIDVIDEYRDFK